MEFYRFIELALAEDIGDGDHSTLACIPAGERGIARLKIKENGVIAGIDIAEKIFQYLEPAAKMTLFKKDGDEIQYGETAFEVEAGVHTILKAERLVLNIMQRMSGIATLTRQYVNKINDHKTRILDTRKTTPNFRWFEKQAVVMGGGFNHRMGLYDMIMLKDNHIDYAGSIEKAIEATNRYLQKNNYDLQIEIEARNLDDVKRIVVFGGVQRIMLDNFSPELIEEALSLIDSRFETEASGGINLDNIVAYAQTGVDYISAGAIIHHAVSMDLSLKAIK